MCITPDCPPLPWKFNGGQLRVGDARDENGKGRRQSGVAIRAPHMRCGNDVLYREGRQAICFDGASSQIPTKKVAQACGRIRFLEQRKQRLLSARGDDDSSSAYWTSSDLLRIEDEIRDAKSELAQREG